MDDYISRQLLLRDIEEYHVSDGKFQHWVEVQPSADVQEVKHGKWINDRGVYRCSSCGELWVYWWAAVVPPEKMAMRMKWCPNCGAKMREEAE